MLIEDNTFIQRVLQYSSLPSGGGFFLVLIITLMQTLAELYPDTQGKTSMIFGKYPELQFWDAVRKYPFVAAHYGPDTIGSEATRFLPISGNTTSLVPQSIFADHALLSYLQATYPWFNSQWLIPYSQGQHLNVLQKTANKLMVVLQPYDIIPQEQYYNDPDMQYAVNDKEHLGKLSTAIPDRKVIPTCELAKICEEFDYHCIIKTPSSASGDGTWIIENKEVFEQYTQKYQREKYPKLIVEEYLELVQNLNINCHIDAHGNMTMLWYSQQIMEDNGTGYNGNIVPKYGQLFTQLPTAVQKILIDMSKYLHTLWYVGVFLPDVVQTTSWTRYLIDPNIRLGGSTTAQCLRERLFAQHPSSEWIQNTSFHIHAQTSQEVINVFQKHKAYLLTCIQGEVPGTYKWYALVHGHTQQQITNVMNSLPHYTW